MKRRNFLKLFPFAGLAAACPAILKAVPVPKVLTIWKGTQVGPTTEPSGISWDNIKADPIKDIDAMFARINAMAKPS